MHALKLPPDFNLAGVVADLSAKDSMFDGRSDHYLSVGLSALNAIEAAWLDSPEPRAILDLPCGYGRVTRILRARYPSAAITVCDLDRPAVDFAAATFAAHGVYSKPNFRDLQLKGPFDLIWVGSLVTHLPEHQTRQFLDFAARHMGPASRLVVTSHGEYVAARLRSHTYGLTEPSARGLIAQYLADGYGYRGYDGGASYGVSLVARAWWENLLATRSSLRLQSFSESGWDRHQDVLVIRRVPGRRGRWRSKASNPSFDQPGVALPLPSVDQESRDLLGVSGFSEGWYRQTFPDVDIAVRDGTFASGLAHYLAYGWKEGRPPFDLQHSFASRAGSLPDAWINGVVGGAGACGGGGGQ
jgi:SAM-dependent methyltransferase